MILRRRDRGRGFAGLSGFGAAPEVGPTLGWLFGGTQVLVPVLTSLDVAGSAVVLGLSRLTSASVSGPAFGSSPSPRMTVSWLAPVSFSTRNRALTSANSVPSAAPF